MAIRRHATNSFIAQRTQRIDTRRTKRWRERSAHCDGYEQYGNADERNGIRRVLADHATASGSNQTVTVNGSGFQSGLTVTVFFPNNNGSTMLNGTQIQSVSATSFQMIVTLSGAGTWGIRVNNPDSQQSNTFNFSVGASSSETCAVSPPPANRTTERP